MSHCLNFCHLEFFDIFCACGQNLSDQASLTREEEGYTIKVAVCPQCYGDLLEETETLRQIVKDLQNGQISVTSAESKGESQGKG